MDSLSNANRDWKKAMIRVQRTLIAEGKLTESNRFQAVCCYSLVHSYCTQLHVQDNADITVVQKARGHKEVRTTQIYTVMSVDPRLAVAVKRAFSVPAKAAKS